MQQTHTILPIFIPPAMGPNSTQPQGPFPSNPIPVSPLSPSSSQTDSSHTSNPMHDNPHPQTAPFPHPDSSSQPILSFNHCLLKILPYHHPHPYLLLHDRQSLLDLKQITHVQNSSPMAKFLTQKLITALLSPLMSLKNHCHIALPHDFLSGVTP